MASRFLVMTESFEAYTNSLQIKTLLEAHIHKQLISAGISSDGVGSLTQGHNKSLTSRIRTILAMNPLH